MTELTLENRITLLKSRQRDNDKIVKKLERKLRILREQKNTIQND